MPSVLIDNMIEQYRYPVLEPDSVETFIDAHDEVVLFFSEDPAKYPESNDVAMILPELVKAFDGRLQAALVGRSAERALQARYGFGAWPALVFLRQGEYLGVITQVQNWEDYLREIRRLLESEPTRPPGFKIPVVSDAAGSCHQ